MGLKKAEAAILAEQIQDAHRFAVGFYQRLLPTITQSAELLGLKFHSWNPFLFDRPSQSKVNPDRKSSWDLIPMSCPHFTFIRQDEKGKMLVGDQMLTVFFCSDPELYEDSSDGEPDPLDMVKETPTIEFELWQAYKSDDSVFFTTLYEKTEGFPEDEEVGSVTKFSCLEASYRSIELSDFLVAPESEMKSFMDNHQANCSQ